MDDDGSELKNDKLKNDSSRVSNQRFMRVWIVVHIAIMILMLPLQDFLLRANLGARAYYSGTALIHTGLLAIVQQQLVMRLLKKPMRGWLAVSLIGMIFSGLTLYDMITSLNIYSGAWPLNPVQIYYLLLFLPPALVQWAYLRRHVKTASLWVLAGAAGAMVYAFPVWTTFVIRSPSLTSAVMTGLRALLYSGVTGATMLYLWTQQRNSEKSKNQHAAEAENTGAERPARLNNRSSKSSLDTEHRETSNKRQASQ